MTLFRLGILNHPRGPSIQGSLKSFHNIHGHVHCCSFLEMDAPATPIILFRFQGAHVKISLASAEGGKVVATFAMLVIGEVVMVKESRCM